MQFKNNAPIYTQLVDLIYDKILSGQWSEAERIPSVREFGEQLSVNPNTVLRAYDQLQNEDIIIMRRGVGYFLLEGARSIVLSKQREIFIKNELPVLKTRLENLGISPEELMKLFSR